MAEDIDPVGRRRDALRQYPLAQQRVDEAGFSRIKFSGNDQEEQSGELLARLLKAAKVVSGNIRTETLQGSGESLEQLLFPGADLLLPLGQDASAGQQLADHGVRGDEVE